MQTVKARLDRKAIDGYTGWDGGYPSSDLRLELFYDATDVKLNENDDKCVDIAARCMMLWFRNKQLGKKE